MAVLTGLEPAGVWKYFEELSNIPRGSYHEKAASDYCVVFAKAHGLEVWQDQAWNIMMVKEASEGYEDAEPIILQGHLDMVCVFSLNLIHTIKIHFFYSAGEEMTGSKPFYGKATDFF